MNSWVNGAKGSEVKRVIDNNFDILDERTIKLNNDILGLNPVNIEFVVSDWVFANDSKIYAIFIPYADCNKKNPCVDVYIKKEDVYFPVYGGHTLEKDGIKLQSDIPYEGRVVIR